MNNSIVKDRIVLLKFRNLSVSSKTKTPCEPISRILSSSIIYLGQSSPIISICLPSSIGRAALHTLVYLAFQPTRFIRLSCYQETLYALTTHFHPYLIYMSEKAVIFCDTICYRPLKTNRHPPVRWCGCSTLFGLSSFDYSKAIE